MLTWEAKVLLIYKVTNNINGKVYIGQTIRTLRERQKQHLTSYKYKNDCSRFYNSIRKHGEENFVWEVIAETDNKEVLDELERYYIAKYNSTSPEYGYNIHTGGTNGYVQSEETKRKIGEAQVGSKNHMYGKTGALNPASKQVVDIDTGEIYENATICAKLTGLNLSKICAVCRGERASTGGHRFAYVGKTKTISSTVKRPKRVFDHTDNKTYFSIIEATTVISPESGKTALTQLFAYYKKVHGTNVIHWKNHKLELLD